MSRSISPTFGEQSSGLRTEIKRLSLGQYIRDATKGMVAAVAARERSHGSLTVGAAALTFHPEVELGALGCGELTHGQTVSFDVLSDKPGARLCSVACACRGASRTNKAQRESVKRENKEPSGETVLADLTAWFEDVTVRVDVDKWGLRWVVSFDSHTYVSLSTLARVFDDLVDARSRR